MQKLIYLTLISIIILSIINCARVGSPVGGEKDILAPEIIESIPNNYSTNFSTDKIEIQLNEFIRFDNLQQKLVISPPLTEKPEIFVKGKSIIINIGKQKLKENTTYTFSFYDAIVDNNEGNAIKDYEFVFSTGSRLDSLSVNGIVLRAFDLEPEKEGIEVLLYDLLDDTVPKTTPPLYIGKPDEEGRFRINNIKSDTFRIFALQDGNRNHYFDQSGETFAFLDSSFLVEASQEFLRDTTAKDTLTADTTEIDGEEILPDVRLFLFVEDHSIQYLKNSTRETREHLQMVFNKPLKSKKLEITPINFGITDQWFIKEEFIVGDTINLWLTDTTVSGLDLITLELDYLKKDSTGNYIQFADTVTLRYIPPSGKTGRGKQISVETQKTLLLTPSIRNNSQIDPNQKIVIESKTPVEIIDTSKIKLFLFEDSLKINTGYILEKDSLQIRKFRFSTEWQEAAKYQLVILPGAFTSIYNYNNDTLILDFNTRKLDYYGKIIVTLKEIPDNLIIQLLDNKGEVKREKTGWKNRRVEFTFLPPGKYRLKAIYDRNKNGKWDTGNYEEKRQPEKVIFYKKELDVRTNWDLEIKWNFETK